MSDPSTTPLPIIPQPNSLIHGGATAPSSSSSAIREYRKGNWTIQETLILITAKKLDDERRLKTSSSSTPQDPTTRGGGGACSRTSGELRWKWVENYCWNHGCLRSQNQCNDKWDNLLRDYKKVRDYESKSESSENFPSYWTLTKQQRKEHNLPSNMLFEIYQAISEVYPRKQTQRILTTPQQPLVTLVTSSPLQTLPPPPPPPLALPLQQPPPPPPQPPVTSTTPAGSGNVVINQCATQLTLSIHFFIFIICFYLF